MEIPSTPQRPDYRLSGLSHFIPLNDESPNAVSTRGQRLPSLLQSRSTTSLFSLPKRGRPPQPRPGSFTSHHSTEDEEHGLLVDDLEPLRKRRSAHSPMEIDARRMSLGPEILNTPPMRSMRLIGQSNPRYFWHKYYKTDEELAKMKKPIRKYYERNNFLIAQYLYIDRLLDSSLPHDLIQEYNRPADGNGYASTMKTISEERELGSTTSMTVLSNDNSNSNSNNSSNSNNDEAPTPTDTRLKRTPKNLYKLPNNENTPLLADEEHDSEPFPDINLDDLDENVELDDPVVAIAIYLNLAANIVLLAGKIAVIIMTSSLSVLASLVDAALDFLSTAIVWTTTKLISQQDQYAYPVGRRRLEPVGVLVFSIIMITSFFQVSLQCFNRLLSPDHSVVELGIPAIAIMLSTVAIKGFCWFWCRLVRNSSVQALAQDAATDVVFNTFSIIFPLVGYYARIWWLDALGGLLLSLYVIFNWSKTSSEHVRNLCGAAATADQRNVLLYLTMRFAKTIRYIQGLQAYHAGDKLNVEVDIVLDENMSLRDTHDLSESLQYVLESVPMVDRAFVHADYAMLNLPSHMNQQS